MKPRDEHVQRRQHGGSYLLRQRSPLSRLGRQVSTMRTEKVEDDPDEDEGKDVNFHPPALPLLGLCGGPCPSRAPVQLPQVEATIFQVILLFDYFSLTES